MAVPVSDDETKAIVDKWVDTLTQKYHLSEERKEFCAPIYFNFLTIAKDLFKAQCEEKTHTFIEPIGSDKFPILADVFLVSINEVFLYFLGENYDLPQADAELNVVRALLQNSALLLYEQALEIVRKSPCITPCQIPEPLMTDIKQFSRKTAEEMEKEYNKGVVLKSNAEKKEIVSAPPLSIWGKLRSYIKGFYWEKIDPVFKKLTKTPEFYEKVLHLSVTEQRTAQWFVGQNVLSLAIALTLQLTPLESLTVLYRLPVIVMLGYFLWPFYKKGLFNIKPMVILVLACINTVALINRLEWFYLLDLQLAVLGYFTYGFYLLCEKEKAEASVQQVRRKQQDTINPDRLFEKLGTDKMCLMVGDALLPLADPDQGGTILGKAIALRASILESLGFIMPNVRIMDLPTLQKNEYTISVHGVQIASGRLHPGWVAYSSPPENAPLDMMTEEHPFKKGSIYWVRGHLATSDSIDPVDLLMQHHRHVVVQEIDTLFDFTMTSKLIELVKNNYPPFPQVLDISYVSLVEIRQTFVYLLREHVSIRDISHVMERMAEYACYTRDPVQLTERLRALLSRQICQALLQKSSKEKYDTIPVVRLSEVREKLFSANHPAHSRYEDLNGHLSDATQALLDDIQAQVDTFLQNSSQTPVLICSALNRFKLAEQVLKAGIDIRVLALCEVGDSPTNTIATIE